MKTKPVAQAVKIVYPISLDQTLFLANEITNYKLIKDTLGQPLPQGEGKMILSGSIGPFTLNLEKQHDNYYVISIAARVRSKDSNIYNRIVGEMRTMCEYTIHSDAEYVAKVNDTVYRARYLAKASTENLLEENAVRRLESMLRAAKPSKKDCIYPC